MTLITTEAGEVLDTETGEILYILTPDDARGLIAEAKTEFKSSVSHFERAWAILLDALDSGAHIALGYRSESDLLASEFDGYLNALDVANRRVVVRGLASRGNSTRAIAPVVGVSKDTVQRDQAAGVSDETPASTPEGEEVAATYSSPSPTSEVGPPTTTPPRPPVTGIDGKTYAAPKPPTPKPVLDGDAAEYENAEKSSLALARAITKLLQFQHPNMRTAMRRYWKTASVEVPPTPRRDVTPEQMRVAAQGLLTLADEWESA